MAEDKIPRVNITNFTVGLEADPATRGFSSEVQIEITKEEERNRFFSILFLRRFYAMERDIL